MTKLENKNKITILMNVLPELGIHNFYLPLYTFLLACTIFEYKVFKLLPLFLKLHRPFWCYLPFGERYAVSYYSIVLFKLNWVHSSLSLTKFWFWWTKPVYNLLPGMEVEGDILVTIMKYDSVLILVPIRSEVIVNAREISWLIYWNCSKHVSARI